MKNEFIINIKKRKNSNKKYVNNYIKKNLN